MTKLLASLAIILASVFAPLAPASAAPSTEVSVSYLDPSDFRPCLTDEAEESACYWDAQGRGNGLGQSVIVEEDGSSTPVKSLTMEAQAWDLFDAVDAADLLPAEGAMVTYVGHSDTAYALTADTVTVWDNHGHHYLFQIG